MPPKKRDPRAGGQIRPLSDRDKFVAKGKGKGLSGGHWEVIGGKKVWVKD
ncbi:hypothetical protein [Streptomyces sp.]